jgi:hypothetical protein
LFADKIKVGFIDAHAFEENEHIKEIKTWKGLMGIGPWAFKDCPNLERIELTNSLYQDYRLAASESDA